MISLKANIAISSDGMNIAIQRYKAKMKYTQSQTPMTKNRHIDKETEEEKKKRIVEEERKVLKKKSNMRQMKMKMLK